MGLIERTFTKPMTMPDGTTIEPMDRKFRLSVATLGPWGVGAMDVEQLWDNQAFREQIGLGER
jgi:hypothetical protein